MKKITLITLIVFIALSFSRAQNINSLYLRPSVTYMYLKSSDHLTNKVYEYLSGEELLGKYNDNSITNKYVPAQISEQEDLNKYLLYEVSPEVMKIWFPFNRAKNEFSLDVIAERGMYNATDREVIVSNATVRKEGLMKDVGFDLLNKSYVIVYHLESVIYTESSDNKNFTASGNIYLYKLDWTTDLQYQLFNQWNNEDALKTIEFPLVCLDTLPLYTNTSQTKSLYIKELSYEDLFDVFCSNILKDVDITMAKFDKGFTTTTSIFDTYPIQIKIGKKEGVTVDQRYFVYELELNEDGDIVEKRKGVIRATNKIAENEGIATGESEISKFYQVQGQRLRSGMLVRQNQDNGSAISFTGGTMINIILEMHASTWGSKMFPKKKKWGRGSKIYLNLAIPLIDTQGDVTTVGFSKDVNIGRNFALVPYIGGSYSIVNYEDNFFGIDIGSRTTFALSPNTSLIGGFGYNTLPPVFYGGTESGVNMNFGLRRGF